MRHNFVMKMANSHNYLLQPVSPKNHYVKVINELVDNSLNANASCIAVRFDLHDNVMQVIDNGDGIEKSKLESLLISKNNKRENLCNYNTITNIASKSDMILIESLHKAATSTYCKEYKRDMSSSKIHKVRDRESTGTTIKVVNFKKNNKIDAYLENQIVDEEMIKKSIKITALIKFHVSFSVRNEKNNDVILKIPKTLTITQKLSLLFDYKVQSELKFINYIKREYSIDLYVAENWYHSKKIQYLYINNKYIDDTMIYEYFNFMFNKLWNNHSKKLTKKNFPVFIINIKCPYKSCEIHKDVIEELIKKAVLQISRKIPQQKFFFKNPICIKSRKKPKPKDLKRDKELLSSHIKKCRKVFLNMTHNNLKLMASKFQCNSAIKRFDEINNDVKCLLKPELKRFKDKKISSTENYSKIQKCKGIFKQSSCTNNEKYFMLLLDYISDNRSSNVKCFFTISEINHLKFEVKDVLRKNYCLRNKYEIRNTKYETDYGNKSMKKNIFSNSSLTFDKVVKYSKFCATKKFEIENFRQNLKTDETIANSKSLEIHKNQSYDVEKNMCNLNDKPTKETHEIIQCNRNTLISERSGSSLSMKLNNCNLKEINENNKHWIQSQKNHYYDIMKKSQEAKCHLIEQSSQNKSDMIKTIEKQHAIFTNIINSNKIEKEINGNFEIVENSMKSNLNILTPKDTRAGSVFYKLIRRPALLPKGCSQIYKLPSDIINKCKNKVSFQLNESNQYYNKTTYESIAEKTRIVNLKELQPILINNKIHQLVYDKNNLSTVTIINQVEKRYICGKMQVSTEKNPFLVLFDQHAVDERIKLENALRDYNNTKLKMVTNIKDIVLSFDSNIFLAILKHKRQFLAMGLSFDILIDAENTILIKSVPLILFEKYNEDVNMLISKIEEIFMNEINVIDNLKGNISTIPKTIFEIMCMEACHNAVKFGAILQLSECEDMIKKLSKCDIPFQCAHGRPAMTILMEVQNFNIQYQVNIFDVS